MSKQGEIFQKLVSISTNELELTNGSKIAVVGGGPAGSFFSYFALEFARRMDLEIEVDIFEPKVFTKPGPSGCNHCGGIVSESLVQVLSAEGIILPTSVIRRGIESYTIHLENGSAVIETPLREQRIASVYRGFGPKGSNSNGYESFDGYLLSLCEQQGAKIINKRVKGFERNEDGIVLKTGNDSDAKYDLIVGSAGINFHTLKLFKEVNPALEVPKSTKTHICELYMDADDIDTYFGNSMHVFLLNIPHVKFGALIPKGNYVTLVLLGDSISNAVVDDFLSSDSVKNCFPPEVSPRDLMHCHCFPLINVQGAKSAYADRVILIGDSASSKLYKNGIGAAYITSKAAAKTAIFHGISNQDFKKHYQKVCDRLEYDNMVGKFIFYVTEILQKSSFLKKGLYKTILKEQSKVRYQRRLSSILWDTFTGSAPYTDILLRGMHPYVGSSYFWNTLKGILTKPQN